MSGHWALLGALDVGADGDPYLDRLKIVQTPWFGIYLHHIHRPDKDPDPHDHPWWFASLVLCGSYTECVWPDKRETPSEDHPHRYRRRWSLRSLSRNSAHIITEIRGPLWTLVLVGRNHGDGWGFWHQGEFIHWRKYIGVPG